MHDARAIANFFIHRADEKAFPVTSMTLLKVLYFAHAWHLAQFDQPLVAQPFEAWKRGPVNRVVYDQVKAAGSQPIRAYLNCFDASLCKFVDAKFDFDAGLGNFLGNIFDFYSQFHAFTLSDLTHEKGSPWDQVWSEAEKRAVPGMVISNEKIRTWFLQSGSQHLRSAQQRYAV